MSDAASKAAQAWIIFDLDDTLHDFQAASRAAIDAVFASILDMHPHLSAARLHEQYRDICRTSVAAFTDGRSSFDYRRERFSELLCRACVPADALVEKLVTVYTSSFENAVRVMPDAASVLERFVANGWKIAVLSEGPHDAQERTLMRAGLQRDVDLLMTSNSERISKRDGLFRRFLDVARALPEHCLVVGDSIEHDIEPARLAGMTAVHFDPYLRRAGSSSYRVISRLTELPAVAALAAAHFPSAEAGTWEE